MLFYTNYGVELQRRFFDHFLKGKDNGWDLQPPVQLQVRHANGTFVLRYEAEWPIARTKWHRYFLDCGSRSLRRRLVRDETRCDYSAMRDEVTFRAPPFRKETEITGPIVARLFISSSTKDADLFVIVRAFDSSSKEVTFQGSNYPDTPIAQGWLRASHRKLDVDQSLPWRPYHSHDQLEPLIPGNVYEVNVEIWPTCIVLPPGFQIALTIRGSDYVYAQPGPFQHNDPVDRPKEVFAGRVTLYTGGRYKSHVLVPIVPRV